MLRNTPYRAVPAAGSQDPLRRNFMPSAARTLYLSSDRDAPSVGGNPPFGLHFGFCTLHFEFGLCPMRTARPVSPDRISDPQFHVRTDPGSSPSPGPGLHLVSFSPAESHLQASRYGPLKEKQQNLSTAQSEIRTVGFHSVLMRAGSPYSPMRPSALKYPTELHQRSPCAERPPHILCVA